METKYVAADGTEFTVKEECEKYEKSAECVIKSRLKTNIIKKLSEYELFGFGSDEYELVIVCPYDSEDIDNMLFLMKCLNSSAENYDKAYSNLHIGENYLFGIGTEYDQYDNFYYYGTCTEILNSISKNLGVDDDLEDE